MKSFKRNLSTLFLTTSLFLIVTTGCGLFEKESTIDTSHLVGLWTISDADVIPEVEGLPLKNYFTDALGMSGLEAEAFAALYDAFLQESFGGTVEFRDDNTYSFTVAGDAENGTWSLNSKGNEIIMNGATQDEMIITILELTGTTLKVSYDELSMQDLDSNPETPDVQVAMKIEMTLTK